MSRKEHSASSEAHGQASARAKSNQEVTNTAAIHVTNERELYEAVEDPSNAGASIFLGRGTSQSRTYVLTRRLLLQRDMKLYGVEGDRSAIKIDTTSLAISALTQNNLRVSSIAVGLGVNAIEWLTIIGNAQAAGGIGSDLPGADPTTIRVAHVISGEGSDAFNSRGIDIRNTGLAFQGQTRIGRIFTVEIEDCEFFGQKQGIRIANFPGSDGAEIHAFMKDNHSHGNSTGCLIANNGVKKSTVTVASDHDTFEDNAAACVIYGGLGNATENFARLEAKNSYFQNNWRAEVDTDIGGIVAIGGVVLNNQSVASKNHAELRVEDCTIENNHDPNFVAYGARNRAATNPRVAGTDNVVLIELYGGSELTDVMAIPSEPAETGSITNRVKISRG